jgi:hypothetical protein
MSFSLRSGGVRSGVFGRFLVGPRLLAFLGIGA